MMGQRLVNVEDSQPTKFGKISSMLGLISQNGGPVITSDNDNLVVCFN